MPTPINLLFALNAGYLMPMCVCIKSIMLSNPDEHFDIYVAHSSLEDADFEKIGESADMTRCNIIPIKVDRSVFEGQTFKKRISIETYYRLLAMDFLPRTLDRALYLDPDTVVINSLRGFYDLDFKGDLYAGSAHYGPAMWRFNRIRLFQKKTTVQVNAGVLLMNLTELRKRSSTKRVVDFLKNNKAYLFLADQDTLNVLYGGEMLITDARKYNLDERTYKKHSSEIDMEWVKKNTVIIHYNGRKKPWKEKYRGKLGQFYFDLVNN